MSKNSGLVWKTWSNLILLVGVGNPQGWHGHSHGLHCCEDVLENQFGIGASVFLRESLSMDDPHLLDKCSFPALPRAYQQTTVRWVKNIRHKEAVYTKHVTGAEKKEWFMIKKKKNEEKGVMFISINRLQAHAAHHGMLTILLRMRQPNVSGVCHKRTNWKSLSQGV